MEKTTPRIELIRATILHVEPIMELVNGLAAKGVMLPRSPASIVEKLRDFVVAYVATHRLPEPRNWLDRTAPGSAPTSGSPAVSPSA